jgi:hypothetical protein
MKFSKSNKKLQKRIDWWEQNVDKSSGRAKSRPGSGSPTGAYHKPGSNKK